jgi:6,7-dimethyl-8-ribityllumazine synthase
MLTSFHVGRYIDLADFKKLTTFLEAIGFVRATKKNQITGFESATFSAPVASFWIGTLKEGMPKLWVQDISMSLGLNTSDPALVFEAAKRLRLHVRGQDSAVEPSPDGPFSIMFGSVLVSVRKENGPSAGLEGKLDAKSKRFGVVVSRFNSFITERLLESALDALERLGATREDIQVVRVPGAFEIPLAARTLAETKKYDAVICIGCLLRGDTAHYDVIVNEVTRGIGQSAQETGVPHAFGVLTCDTLEQAIDRAGLKMGNKGFEAALAAVEMANLRTALGKAALSSQLLALGKSKSKRKLVSSTRKRKSGS